MEFEIHRNSNPGDLVLDPFSGSGVVGLESILAGRNFIGYDLNPLAICLSQSTVKRNFNVEEFDAALIKLKNDTKKRIMELYKHGDSYVLYSVPGHGNKKDYNVVLCDYEFKKTSKDFIPNLDVKYGLELQQNIEIPDAAFPSSFYKDRFSYKGVSKVSDLFSTRALRALGILREGILSMPKNISEEFMMILTNTLLHVTKLKSENIRPLGVNNYWIPDDFIEENVFWRFEDRAQQFKLAKMEIARRFREVRDQDTGNAEFREKSSIPLIDIQDNSIDYILTDPPYGDVIQYSELSFVWNVWLGKSLDNSSELIVNPVQSKNSEYFVSEFAVFLNDCFRVLKNGKLLTLCFQNKDPIIWFRIAKIAQGLGFGLTRIETFDFLGATFNKNWATKSPKVDIYLTLSKEDGFIQSSKTHEILIFQDLIKMIHNKENSEALESVLDPYSRVIAMGIIEIFNGKDVKEFTKKEIEKFVMDANEEGMNSEKYNDLRLF